MEYLAVNFFRVEPLYWLSLPLLVLLLGLPGILLLALRRLKLRRLGEWLALIPILIGIAFPLAASRLRHHYATIIVEQAEPVIQALTAYHREHNTYPNTLGELTPQYLAALPDFPQVCVYKLNMNISFITACALGFVRNADGYELRFELPGPVFGSHFFYSPLQKYPDWVEPAYQLHKRIGSWGWYYKV